MKRTLLLMYGGLLIVSASWKEWNPRLPPALEGQASVAVTIASDEEAIDIRYWDTKREGLDERPALVLLHGSPMASEYFDPLLESLGEDFRLIVPDLPGFGRSRKRIDDYSIDSHARYLRSFLDAAQVEEYHLLGYSMGGGVALAYTRFEAVDPRSLTLVSSIGLQEFELLGDYTLNHALHAAQLFVFWSLEWLTPHFGLLDGAILNYRYARNFYDTDQRPLRDALLDWGEPALIVHGERDGLVPFQAAQAHLKAMPHAQFKAYKEAGHLLSYRESDRVAEDIKRFVWSVETGEAARRSPMQEVAPEALPRMQRSHMFMGALLGVATFVSEDLACIGGGLLATKGATPLWVAVTGCLLGIFIGDFAIYLMGRFLGRSVLGLPVLNRILSPARVDRCARWLDEKGLVWIVSTRFIPGTRAPTYFVAGMVKAGPMRFAMALLAGAILWTPLLVGLSYWLGGAFLSFFEEREGWALLGLLVVSLGLLTLARLSVGLLSWQGRRLLYSRFKRLARWEYWPMWVFYPPILMYVFWQMVKRRSATSLTCVNPCMPASGLVYESKSEILAHLERFEAPIGRFALIPLRWERERKGAALGSFMKRNNLKFPVVLKPDAGQRGQGVDIVHSEQEAMAFFDSQLESTVAQEYLPGNEYGIFYYRLPGHGKGEILSLTDKRLIEVVGDGASRLERLILADERAVGMARFFLEAHRDSLDRILGDGERYRLTQLGTHCRGALFLDGGHLRTPELEAAVDEMSRDVEGFYFGRYDIRAPSEADLKAGRNLRIIELNGLTSESTHMYDPKHSLFYAYKALFRQFEIAFEIADINRAAGIEADRFRSLLRLAHCYWKGMPSGRDGSESPAQR